MSRIIFFVLIVAVIYFAWRSMRLKQIQLEKRLDKQEKANLAAVSYTHLPWINLSEQVDAGRDECLRRRRHRQGRFSQRRELRVR